MRCHSTGDNMRYKIGVPTSGVNLAWPRAICVATFWEPLTYTEYTWLRTGFGVSPKCRWVSVGFSVKNEKTETEIEHLSVGFYSNLSVKPWKRTSSQSIKYFCVGNMWWPGLVVNRKTRLGRCFGYYRKMSVSFGHLLRSWGSYEPKILVASLGRIFSFSPKGRSVLLWTVKKNRPGKVESFFRFRRFGANAKRDPQKARFRFS